MTIDSKLEQVRKKLVKIKQLGNTEDVLHAQKDENVIHSSQRIPSVFSYTFKISRKMKN